jgi:dihydroxyacetone kinase-like predicted kinase
VRKGQFAGFTGKRILAAADGAEEALLALCDALSAASCDVILVFTGQDAGDPDVMQATLQARYPRSEAIVRAGGQPVYDYILVLF